MNPVQNYNNNVFFQYMEKLPEETQSHIFSFYCKTNSDVHNLRLVNTFWNEKAYHIPREKFSAIIEFSDKLIKETKIHTNKQLQQITHNNNFGIIYIKDVKFICNIYKLRDQIIDVLIKLPMEEFKLLETKFTNEKFPKFLDNIFDLALFKKTQHFDTSKCNSEKKLEIFATRNSRSLKLYGYNRTIAEIENGKDKNYSFCALSYVLIYKEEIDRAIEVISKVPLTSEQTLKLEIIDKINVKLVVAKRYKDALNLIGKEIPENFLQLHALGNICIELTKTGEVYTAKEIFKDISKDSFFHLTKNYSTVIKTIVILLLKIEDFEKAIEFTKSLTVNDIRLSMFHEIANSLYEKGKASTTNEYLHKAVELLDESVPNRCIYCVDFKFEIITNITILLFNRGYVDEAKKIADTKLVGEHKDNAIKQISIELSKIDNLSKAEEFINNIKCSYEKMHALEFIYSKYIQMKKLNLVIEKASNLIEPLKSMAQAFIVKKLTAIHMGLALKVADSIMETYNRDNALTEIFKTHLYDGDVKEAKIIYGKISNKLNAGLFVSDKLNRLLDKLGADKTFEIIEMLDKNYKENCFTKLYKKYSKENDIKSISKYFSNKNIFSQLRIQAEEYASLDYMETQEDSIEYSNSDDNSILSRYYPDLYF